MQFVFYWRKMVKIIGVISLKGGVGKTSSVVALGASLANMKKRVLLVDANFSSPNLGIHLNLIDPPITLHHVLERSSSVKDAIYKLENNIDLLPSSIFGKKISSPMKLRDKLRSVKNKYDIILIDSSPAMNEEVLASILASDEILVVTTPDYPTLSATIKAVKLAKSRGVPIVGLILNKVFGKDFELSIKDIEKVTGVSVMALIPHDINFLKSLSKFKSSVLEKPRANSSIEFKKLASMLVGEKYSAGKILDMFNVWKILVPKQQEVNREVYYSSLFD